MVRLGRYRVANIVIVSLVFVAIIGGIALVAEILSKIEENRRK